MPKVNKNFPLQLILNYDRLEYVLLTGRNMNVQDKLLNLALHPLTSEKEAIAAFLAVRRKAAKAEQTTVAETSSYKGTLTRVQARYIAAVVNHIMVFVRDNRDTIIFFELHGATTVRSPTDIKFEVNGPKTKLIEFERLLNHLVGSMK